MCAAEMNQLKFIQGKKAYYIFRISEEGAECIYRATYSWKEQTFFATTRYLIEFRSHQHLVRCVPFNIFL